VPNGRADNIRFSGSDQDQIKIEFDYIADGQRCRAEYTLNHKLTRPRRLCFSINGEHFERELGEDYKQQLAYSGGIIPIEDPLKLSVQRFVRAVTSDPSEKTDAEILDNVRLQDYIIKRYLESLEAAQ